MRKKNNTTLVVGVLIVGGFIAYEYWKGQQATATTTSLPTDTSGGGAAILPTSTTTASTPAESIITTTAPVPTITTPTGPVDLNGNPLPSGISQNVYNKVYSWAYSDGRAPVIAMAQALIPSEYNGMYDIITTQWTTGAAPTTAQRAFWDNLRNKYDPQHKQW